MGSGTLGNLGRAIFGGIANRKTQRAVQSLLEEASVSMENPNYSYRDFLLSAVRRRVSQDPRVKEYGELIKQRDKQMVGKQKTEQLGQATRDISQGLGAPQGVPETGQAPAPGPVSPPELAGLGGGPAQQPPRSGSPIPQQPGVLSGQGFQEFGEPPATQEQALGRLAEYQEAGAAPETTVKDALSQPAIAQYPTQKEADAQALRVKREARITEDSQTRAKQRQQRLGLQERQLSATILRAKKDNKIVGDAMDGLFKSVTKNIKEINKAIGDDEKIVNEMEAGYGADDRKTIEAKEELDNTKKELQATQDARMFVVNNYSADLTPSKVDLAISMAKQEIQNGTYRGMKEIFQKLRVRGAGLGQSAPAPAPAPAGDDMAQFVRD